MRRRRIMTVAHGIAAGAILGWCVAAAANAEPAMWVIKDDDSTIYLLGTFHILKPETVWHTDRIREVVRESTELWLEVADLDDAAVLLQKYGFDRKKPLSRRLKKEDLARLSKVAASYTFPMSLLDQMKPWYAAITLTLLPMAKAGYNPNAGVEQVLKFQAQVEGDKIGSFETLEEQFRLMNDFSEADQIAFLRTSITDVEKGVEYLDRLAEAWSAGETEKFEREFLDEMKREAPAEYEQLFVQRNVRWSGKIADMLKRSGVQMIAVGAGHLIGPDSVQVQLGKKGLKAERY